MLIGAFGKLYLKSTRYRWIHDIDTLRFLCENFVQMMSATLSRSSRYIHIVSRFNSTRHSCCWCIDPKSFQCHKVVHHQNLFFEYSGPVACAHDLRFDYSFPVDIGEADLTNGCGSKYPGKKRFVAVEFGR